MSKNKLSDEDVERIAEALARKIAPQRQYVVPTIVWPGTAPSWTPPPIYTPWVVTCGANSGTLYNGS